MPRAAIRFEANDDLTIFASAARGYIPGGFNLTAIQEGVTAENVLSYDKETLWSREIGVRWRNPSRNVRASGAVFYITSENWQEIQIATDELGRPITSDFIGSDASIRNIGFEMEASWDVTDALSIDGHFGYVDAEYRDLPLDDVTNVKGQPIQFAPEYDGNLAARYEWPFGAFIRGEINLAGEYPLRARGDVSQDAVATYGLQLGWESERFAARVFGENLSNERISSGLAITNLAFGFDGAFYAPLSAPRIIGVELEARF